MSQELVPLWTGLHQDTPSGRNELGPCRFFPWSGHSSWYTMMTFSWVERLFSKRKRLSGPHAKPLQLTMSLMGYYRTLAWWLECSPMAWETYVQSQVESYQKLKICYLMPPCLTLSIIRCGSRVKWYNSGKVVAPSPTLPCCSYRKESLWTTFDYSRQFDFFYYICSHLLKYCVRCLYFIYGIRFLFLLKICDNFISIFWDRSLLFYYSYHYQSGLPICWTISP